MSGAPVGVFDSGVGGLTVARAILDQLPAEPLLYLGDTAHAPYGPRPLAEVRRHALSAMDHLVSEGVKLLVIACNSASAACLGEARERYDIPVVEVVLPATRRAVAATRSGRVGVIGTVATIASGAYENAFAGIRAGTAPQPPPRAAGPGRIRRAGRPGAADRRAVGAYPAAAPGARPSLTAVACPAFVDFVERGITSGRQLLGLAEAYLAPLQEAGVDTLILGCTHYPLLTGLIGLVMGEGVTLVSSAEETAKDVYRVLAGTGESRDPALPPPAHRFLTTGDPAALHRLGRRFLGPEIDSVSVLPDRAGPADRAVPAARPHVPPQSSAAGR
jgi:glutamate racemase